tara:strand:- start:320 stop:2029 length:1710 start_codon:yes stop_codon:yes gene_type:complete
MTNNLLILSLSYFLIPISIIGYGILFQKLFLKNFENYNFGYLGLLGIFFLIIYAYLSNLLIAHTKLHNLIILLIGFIIFSYFFLLKKKDNFKKQSLLLFFILLLIFISILIFKNHDDFAYYHFPYTYLLTQNELIIGIGNLGHGFRTHSSLFFLNSLFYLPFVDFFLFNFGTVLILLFSNLILINIILYKYSGLKLLKYNRFYIYLSLFIFSFINIFFYRIAEHGTDRSAQILIFLLFIETIFFFNDKILSKNNIVKILLLLSLIISFKAFYFLYFVIFIPITIIIFRKKKKLKNVFSFLFVNKFFPIFSLLIFFVLLNNFLNTGCLIYPVYFTCFDLLSWSIPIQEVKDMNNWYELWSKAGAGVDYRVKNADLYIQKFNWLGNWFKFYFINKISDFLLGIIFLILIFFIVFFDRKQKINKKIKNLSFVYLAIFILFFEWFYNHPALRYGGYALFFLLLIIPVSNFLCRYDLNEKKFFKRIIIILSMTIIIFLGRNISRLHNENLKYAYNPLKNSFYTVNSNHFRIEKKLNEILKKNELCENKKKVETCLGEFEKISNFFGKTVIINKK